MEQTEHLVSWCINAVGTILHVLMFKITALVVFCLLGDISMKNMLSEIMSWNAIRKKKTTKDHGYISEWILLPTGFPQQSSFLLSKGHIIHIKYTRLRKNCDIQESRNIKFFRSDTCKSLTQKIHSHLLPPPTFHRYVNSHKCLASKQATSISVNQWR